MRALPLLLLAGCGTWSSLKPAQVAPRGHVELVGGVAANQLGEVLPVGDIRVGVARRVDLGAHYEVYNGFGEVRVQLLEQPRQWLDLTVGLGAGIGATVLDGFDDSPDFAGFASLALSHRFGRLEPYLSNRFAYLIPKAAVVTAPVLGVRVRLADWLDVTAEGGAAIHVRYGVATGVAQGALGFGLHF